MTYSSTSNLGLKLINFDTSPWHDDTNDNWRLLDTVVSAATGVVGLAGAWSTSLAITVGQKYVDPDDLTIWECLIAHTSPTTGTFAAARAANPTYWEGLATGLRARGEWATGVSYSAGDLAYDSSEILYCVCATSHVATTSMRDDIANWTILVDASEVAASAAILYTSQTLTTSQKNQAKDNIDVRGAAKTTLYTTSGTHTWDAKTRFFKIEGGGGGGGGGGVDGGDGSSKSASAGGGGSGFEGETLVITKPASNATIVIGSGGAGGAAGNNNGSNGSDTTWSDGTNAFTFGGGKGGTGAVAAANGQVALPGGIASSTGSVYGSSEVGQAGRFFSVASPPTIYNGAGATGKKGSGGAPGLSNTAGNAATGFSAGGAGGAVYNSSTDRAGGNGADGYIIVHEYF